MSAGTTAPAARTARETVELLLRTVVEGSRDQIADLYAPDVRIENPWSSGGPRISEGREVLRAQMAGTAKLWDFESVDGVVLHQSTDPEVVVAEYRVHGRIKADGKPFSLGFVCVLRVVDGLIVHSRDYSNPAESSALMELFQAQSAA